MPVFFRNLHPALTSLEFKNLVNDSSFLNKEFYLCEDCYIEVTKFSRIYGCTSNKFQTKFTILSEALRNDPVLRTIYVIFQIFQSKIKFFLKEKNKRENGKKSEKTEKIEEKVANPEISKKNTQENEENHQKFLVKNIFLGKIQKNKDNLGSTRPQTSNSKSVKSLNYSKNEISSDNKKSFLSRPNSSMLKLQKKEDFFQAGYLNYAYQKENNEIEERKNKVYSAKTVVNRKNSKCELYYPELLGRKNETSNEVFEKYPQFYDKLQRNLMKDLEKY